MPTSPDLDTTHWFERNKAIAAYVIAILALPVALWQAPACIDIMSKVLAALAPPATFPEHIDNPVQDNTGVSTYLKQA